MTDIIQPIINNNGTSRQSMVDYRIAIADALRDTMVAMQEIKPNGRDYIGHLDAYTRDREIYAARYRALDAIYNDVMEEALHIKNY